MNSSMKLKTNQTLTKEPKTNFLKNKELNFERHA
jgi:hypothetical protein